MRVFSDDRIEAMHDAALRVLEELGVKVLLPEARDILVAGGATLKADDMVHIGRDMVMAAIESAPRYWRAPPPRARRVAGTRQPGLQPGAGCPHATDLARGRRPEAADDFRDLVRLTQHFDVLHMVPPLVEPQDVPINLRHYFTMEAQLTLSDKFPFIFSRGTPQVERASRCCAIFVVSAMRSS